MGGVTFSDETIGLASVAGQKSGDETGPLFNIISIFKIDESKVKLRTDYSQRENNPAPVSPGRGKF